MKLFLDQNIPKSTVKELVLLGFQVEHASEVGLSNASDEEIAEYAKKQNAILITKDLEFGSSIIYPSQAHHGLIILRLPNYFTAHDIVRILKNFLEKFDPNNLVKKIVILELGRYRIRAMS